MRSEHLHNFLSPWEYRQREVLQKAFLAYIQPFDQANETMAKLVENILGTEAADVVSHSNTDQRAVVKKLFHEAALETVSHFAGAIDECGEVVPGNEAIFWIACNQEGPIAKKYLHKLISMLQLPYPPEETQALLNTVTTQDGILLALRTLENLGQVTPEEAQHLTHELLSLCRQPSALKELLLRVISPKDHYYPRITREKKVNDESILKFNAKKNRSETELLIVELGLRLANATWFAAQRHCARKEGNTDRIHPKKRNGVFNSPNHRHVHQYKDALARGCTQIEAVMILTFELIKDVWMLEE